MPWADVVAPAEAACRDGYPVGGAAARYLSFTAHSLFGRDPEAFRVVTRARRVAARRRATSSTNHPLADVLDLVAREGASVLTTGEVGRAMVDDMAAHGGLVTHRDLAEYTPARPAAGAPHGRRLGPRRQPAAVGGRPDARGHARRAAAPRELALAGHHRDPARGAALPAPTFTTSPHDLDAAGHELLLSRRPPRPGRPADELEHRATSRSSTADGTACAITVSSGYGAGITVPGTGMLLNNALGEPELNKLGLHRLVPGHPARVEHGAHDGAHRATAGCSPSARPGADRITTALMLVLGQGCLHGADLQHAIEAPRLHVRFDEDGVAVVEHETDAAIADAVRAAGLHGARPRHPADVLRWGGRGLPARGRRARRRPATPVARRPSRSSTSAASAGRSASGADRAGDHPAVGAHPHPHQGAAHRHEAVKAIHSQIDRVDLARGWCRPRAASRPAACTARMTGR